MRVTPTVCIAAALLGATLIVNTGSWDRAGLIDSALAQPGKPSPTFDLYLCSASKRAVRVAIIGIEGNQLRARGWTKLATKRDCSHEENYQRFGTLGRPRFWWHATDGEVTWNSPNEQLFAYKVPVCVNLNDNFDFTWDGKTRDCKADEQLVDF